MNHCWWLASIIGLSLFGCGARHRVALPYGESNPVIYDNDSAVDVYTDEYVLALSSLGEIQLKGMITSSSIAPENRFVPPETYETEVNNREALALAARASGFRNVPTPIRGPKGQLYKPGSGRIEDTKPIGSEGSRLIVAEARKATVERPLVVVAGGPLTAEADAYLLDPSIRDKVIVAWLGGRYDDMGDYNGWADGWAAFVVLQKLRLVQFPVFIGYLPHVPKSQLLELPASPLREFMYQRHWDNGDPFAQYDGDAPPIIALMRGDYSTSVKAVTFNRYFPLDNQDVHEVPAFGRDLVRRSIFRILGLQERGRALVVVKVDQGVATTEWWRAIRKAFGVG